MRRTLGFLSALLVVATTVVGASPGWAADPTFTTAQANEGNRLYRNHCSNCHGRTMRGEHITPALVGDRFDRSFRGKSASVLAFHMRRMPPEPVDNPGGLGDEVYGKILAHILRSNGFEAGEAAMPIQLTGIGFRLNGHPLGPRRAARPLGAAAGRGRRALVGR